MLGPCWLTQQGPPCTRLPQTLASLPNWKVSPCTDSPVNDIPAEIDKPYVHVLLDGIPLLAEHPIFGRSSSQAAVAMACLYHACIGKRLSCVSVSGLCASVSREPGQVSAAGASNASVAASVFAAGVAESCMDMSTLPDSKFLNLCSCSDAFCKD